MIVNLATFIGIILLQMFIMMSHLLNCSGTKKKEEKKSSRKTLSQQVSSKKEELPNLPLASPGSTESAATNLKSEDSTMQDKNTITLDSTSPLSKYKEKSYSETRTQQSKSNRSRVSLFSDSVSTQHSFIDASQQSIENTVSSKSEERNQSIKLEPKELHFEKMKGGTGTVTLSNLASQRLAIKAKCSNNSIYRIEPVFAIVDANASREFKVFRLEGSDDEKARLIFEFARVDDTVEDAAAYLSAEDVLTQRKAISLTA